jgi:acetyltransferase
MQGLLARNYPGKIYPINRGVATVYGLPAHPDVTAISAPIDLAVLTIPEASIEEVVRACAVKGVRGMTIVTAGFGEAIESGRERELALAQMAREHGMRILGPNVSGTFNLHAGFNASASPTAHLFPTALAAVSQGGFALYDLMALASARRMGVGQFIHTGNECDLSVSDFLEHFGADPDVSGILMYLETLRDGKRFVDTARRVAPEKPIVIHKVGRTAGGVRAAQSHTGALAGCGEVYRGVFTQMNVVMSPSMELLFPLARQASGGHDHGRILGRGPLGSAGRGGLVGSGVECETPGAARGSRHAAPGIDPQSGGHRRGRSRLVLCRDHR